MDLIWRFWWQEITWNCLEIMGVKFGPLEKMLCHWKKVKKFVKSLLKENRKMVKRFDGKYYNTKKKPNFVKNSRIWWFTSLITPSKRVKKIQSEWHDILIFSAFIFENCCQVFFQTFSARLWNGYHKSRPVNHSMSRLVPKHFDEKNMEKEEKKTLHMIF